MDLDNARPSVGGNNNQKLEELFELVKLSNKWLQIRILPATETNVNPMISLKQHWIDIIGSKSRKEVRIPKMCVGHDSLTDQTGECPYCDLNNNPSHFYLVNVLVRSLQEDAPAKQRRTAAEKKTGLKEVGSDSWTPIRVLRVPSSLMLKIQGLKDLNKHTVKGEKKAFNVNHIKFGADIMLKHDKNAKGSDQYQVQIADKGALTDEELQYLVWGLDENVAAAMGQETKAVAKKEIAKMEFAGDFDAGGDDGGDDDDDADMGKKRKPAAKKPAAKGKSKSRDDDFDDSADDEDDEEDEEEDERPTRGKKPAAKKPAAKGKSKSRDEDDEDDEDFDVGDDEEDDEEEDERPTRGKKPAPKAKAKSRSRDEDDEDDEEADDEEDEDEEEDERPARGKKPAAKKPAAKRRPADEDDDDLADDEEDEEDEEEEDERPTRGKKPAAKKPAPKGKRRPADDEDDEDAEEEDEEDEEEDERPARGKKPAPKAKAKSKRSQDDDDDFEDDIPF